MVYRHSKVGVVDFSDDGFEDEEARYCPHCLDYGWKEKLGPKILQPQEPKAADYDSWLQCGSCGTLHARHEVTRESEIHDVVSTTDNPHDSRVEFLAVDKRVLGRKSRRRKQQDDYDWIPDEDLKRELKKGSKLLSFSEHIPQ